ncbi:MFS transporter [Saccharospirillum mangrovi]|uniref:MFS transporter n=1 Tax=Saccharospirillum mangrovi TaxID=2161747 RepID=UPI000D357558|nr:MFS transporter [Saccharospirillum mangrovi]
MNTFTKPSTASTARGPKSLTEAWLALLGLSAVFLFEMLDNSILNVALPVIGRELEASNLALQWVTGSYALVFGSLMLLFGAVADRIGRRRVMLVGLAILAIASLATAFVTNATQLIWVRIATGVAAAMTTPGSMALAFRLFTDDNLRVRATTLISTVGLVGLAIGPFVGGLVLTVAPWQVLLLINVPIALLAWLGIRTGIQADQADELHPDPIDVIGAVLGTAAIVLALLTPTLFEQLSYRELLPWVCAAAALLLFSLFIEWERQVAHPLIDLSLLANKLVSSGLAFNAAAGICMAGLGYMITLQLQLGWNWSPATAALGMLPMVAVLLLLSPFVEPVVNKLGMELSASVSASTVVAGLICYGLLGQFGYVWIALSLTLVAAGMRFVGVVAGLNIVRGLPDNRTSIGVALSDTATEVSSASSIAIAGTIMAFLFSGNLTESHWTGLQTRQFHQSIELACLVLSSIAATLVAWGIYQSHNSKTAPTTAL